MSGPNVPVAERRSPSRFVASGSFLLILTYLGFVSLGLPDAAYGVAWPSLREDFALPQGAFGLGLLAVGIGFLCSSTMAGTMLRRFGAGRLLAVSTVLTSLGLCGFALAPSWPVFLLAGLLAGLGGGAIDSGLNAYAAGHYSARQMNWLHAAFGFGAALGPLAMTFALANADWRAGYAAIAGLLAMLAVLFFATRRLWAEDDVRAEANAAAVVAPVGEALRSRLVWLQVATFFFYAGVEIAAGQWAFAILSQDRGYSIESAGFWTGAYWFALFAGRVLLGFGADAIGPERLIRWGSVTALCALVVFALDPAGLGVVGLVIAGFAFAPIFPMLMHRTPRMLGAGLSAHSIGFQVSAAMMGGVAIPSICGVVAGHFGVSAVPAFLSATALLHLVLVQCGLSRDRRTA